jgi:uncharacterized lipoprotein YajG
MQTDTTRATMKTLKKLTASLALILLAGCDTPKVWFQAGSSHADMQRDLAACHDEAVRNNDRLAPAKRGFFNSNNANRDEYLNTFINNCMIAKGYSLVDKTWLPAGAPGVSR